MPTKSSIGCSLEEEKVPPEKRIDRADDLLARLIDDIGTGPAFAQLRSDAVHIKHVLRGLER